MVSNIFSDKTGTLTRNEMKFVQFEVEGRMYHIPYPAQQQQQQQQENAAGPSSHLLDKDLVLQEVKKASASGAVSMLERFITCLTTCHTVIRESDGTYRAESPDELALVQGK